MSHPVRSLQIALDLLGRSIEEADAGVDFLFRQRWIERP
jgi:hypothetical protein